MQSPDRTGGAPSPAIREWDVVNAEAASPDRKNTGMSG